MGVDSPRLLETIDRQPIELLETPKADTPLLDVSRSQGLKSYQMNNGQSAGKVLVREHPSTTNCSPKQDEAVGIQNG